VPSLLLYNPLEALLLIMFCDIFTKRKMTKLDLLHCLGLGAINLSIQYVTTLVNSPVSSLIADIVIALMMSIILYGYYNIVMKCEVKFLLSGASMAFCFFTIPLGIPLGLAIMGNMLDGVYDYTGFSDTSFEFICNITIKTLQFACLGIIKSGVNCFERFKETYENSGKEVHTGCIHNDEGISATDSKEIS
jgi:hypothetical protein